MTGLPADDFCCGGKRYDVSANAACCRGVIIDPNQEICDDGAKKNDEADDGDDDDGDDEMKILDKKSEENEGSDED